MILLFQAGELSKKPFLVMAVLRDGSVTCFDTLCDRYEKTGWW